MIPQITNYILQTLLEELPKASMELVKADLLTREKYNFFEVDVRDRYRNIVTLEINLNDFSVDIKGFIASLKVDYRFYNMVHFGDSHPTASHLVDDIKRAVRIFKTYYTMSFCRALEIA